MSITGLASSYVVTLISLGNKMVLNRTTLIDEIDAYLLGDISRETFHQWVIAGIVGNDVSIDDEDVEFIQAALVEVDTILREVEAGTEALVKVLVLLQQVRSNDHAFRVLQMIPKMNDLTRIIEKYVQGTISRVAFSSFLMKREWDRATRSRIEALSMRELMILRKYLLASQFHEVATLLFRDKDPI
jgi:hypothetical protein